MKKEPKHFELPHWDKKSLLQRIEYLKGILDDLNVYRAIKNLKEIKIILPEEVSKTEECKKNILEHYKKTLKDDMGLILDSLNSLVPYDKQEEIDVETIRKEILENPNILNMNCENGHITGSALVIDFFNKKVLLHKHKKLGQWFQFGGHNDYELNPMYTALRESGEESGLEGLEVVSYNSDLSVPIDIELQTIPEKSNKPKHYHADFRYLVKTKNLERLNLAEGESEDFWWLDINSALQEPDSVISIPVKRLIRKAKRYLEENSN